jgi:negative regulator of replication initiation
MSNSGGRPPTGKHAGQKRTYRAVSWFSSSHNFSRKRGAPNLFLVVVVFLYSKKKKRLQKFTLSFRARLWHVSWCNAQIANGAATAPRPPSFSILLLLHRPWP